MKALKITLSIIVCIIIIVLTAKVAYSIGQHTANLMVKEATPKELAEAMQGDNFYGNYANTMLLVRGTVNNVTNMNNHEIVRFETTTKTNVLPKVFCTMETNESLHTGDTIKILTVAYYAKRQNSTDVSLQNCHLIKN